MRVKRNGPRGVRVHGRVVVGAAAAVGRPSLTALSKGANCIFIGTKITAPTRAAAPQPKKWRTERDGNFKPFGSWRHRSAMMREHSGCAGASARGRSETERKQTGEGAKE